MHKDAFRGPRDSYILLCALFIEKAGARLKELTKFASTLEHTKIPEVCLNVNRRRGVVIVI